MIDEIILESVQVESDDANFEVLHALCEYYSKVFKILNECDYNDQIIQEAYTIFVEQDKTIEKTKDKETPKKSFGEKFKEFFSKAYNCIKSIFKKLSHLVTSRFVTCKPQLYDIVNTLNVFDALSKALSAKVHVTMESAEYNEDDCYIEYDDEEYYDEDDELYQEGDQFSRAEKKIEKYQKKQEKEQQKQAKQEANEKKKQEKQEAKEKNKQEKQLQKFQQKQIKNEKKEQQQQKKQIKNENKQQKQEAKEDSQIQNAARKKALSNLNKYFSTERRHALLSKSEINDIVTTIMNNHTTEEMKIIARDIKYIYDTKKEGFENLSASAMRNEMLVNQLADFTKESNKHIQELTVLENLQRRKEKTSEADIESRLRVMKKFAETLGGTLNELSKTDNFSYENLRRTVYGGHEARLITETVNSIMNVIKNAAITGEKLDVIGRKLYESHIDFDDAVFDEEKRRKELGLEMSKTIELFLFAIDGIKEETYGWADDWFNRRSFKGNPITMVAGGPIALCQKGIKAIISGTYAGIVAGPHAAVVAAGSALLPSGVSGFAKTAISSVSQNLLLSRQLNPDGYQRMSKRNREKYLEHERQNHERVSTSNMTTNNLMNR